MLSRVADSMYWIGRYVERVENNARLLEVNLQLLGDFEGYVTGKESIFWKSIVSTIGESSEFENRYDEYSAESVTQFLAYDHCNTDSLWNNIQRARENARMIRDQISTEMWESINRLYHFMREQAECDVDYEIIPYTSLELIKSRANEFNGLIDSSFVHGDGYRFIQLGKYLERADQTTRVLSYKSLIDAYDPSWIGGAADTAACVAVLRSCGALDAFQAKYVADVNARAVTEFLVLDPAFPRSVKFCTDHLDGHLRSLSGSAEGSFSNQAEKTVGKFRADLTFGSVDLILSEGLQIGMEDLQERLGILHNQIHAQYLNLEF